MRDRTEEEARLIDEMFRCFDALRRIGWQEAMYAPKDTEIELIEPGSTGIHRGYQDEFGFWVVDEMDTYPSRPMLFKPLPN